jgi:hypothetical protein
MKIFNTVFLLAINICSFSQTKTTVYLELRGSVDIMGNMYLNHVEKPRRLETKADSLVDYTAIRNVFTKTNNPVKVLNALAAGGWNLVSVAQVLSDKDGRPNSPFILYYLKREY